MATIVLRSFQVVTLSLMLGVRSFFSFENIGLTVLSPFFSSLIDFAFVLSMNLYASNEPDSI